MPATRCPCLFSALFTAGGIMLGAAAAEPPQIAISRVRAIPNSADESLAARLIGIVNFINVEGTAISIQDNTGAIWVTLPAGEIPKTGLGQRIEVTGHFTKGRFAPDFKAEALRIIDEPGLPKAVRVTGSALFSGEYDCRFVEVYGIVRAVLPWPNAKDTAAMVHLDVEGVRVRILTPIDQFARLSPLVDAVLRVRGMNAVAVNADGQILNVQVRVADAALIEIIEPPRDGAGLPLTAPGKLLAHPVNGFPGHRIRTRGTVIGSRRGEWVQVQDETHGVRAWTMTEGDLPPLGSMVEILGFPVAGPFSPQIEDAEFRDLGMGAAAEPTVLHENDDAKSSDGRLVRVVARLVEAQTDARPARLLLERGNILFAAEFADPVPRESLPATPGAIVEVTGTCEVSVGLEHQDAGYPKAREFMIHLRQASDVRLVKPAPWWTPVRLAVALVGTAAALITLLFFAGLLGRKNQRLVAAETELLTARDALARRVETRTDQLQAQLVARRDEFAEYSAVTAERNRLARDLHDSLEQTLAGAALRMDAASDLLPAGLDPARRQMEKAVELLRLSQAEVRRTVWGLRSLALEKRSLADALRESARLLTEDTGISATLDLLDGDAGLSPEEESELLNIAQEAIANVLKHSQATLLEIALRRDGPAVTLTVKDNGRGFDPAAEPAENSRPHYGQRDMRERAEMLGATLIVESQPAAGARVHVILRPANLSSV